MTIQLKKEEKEMKSLFKRVACVMLAVAMVVTSVVCFNPVEAKAAQEYTLKKTYSLKVKNGAAFVDAPSLADSEVTDVKRIFSASKIRSVKASAYIPYYDNGYFKCTYKYRANRNKKWVTKTGYLCTSDVAFDEDDGRSFYFSSSVTGKTNKSAQTYLLGFIPFKTLKADKKITVKGINVNGRTGETRYRFDAKIKGARTHLLVDTFAVDLQ